MIHAFFNFYFARLKKDVKTIQWWINIFILFFFNIVVIKGSTNVFDYLYKSFILVICYISVDLIFTLFKWRKIKKENKE